MKNIHVLPLLVGMLCPQLGAMEPGVLDPEKEQKSSTLMEIIGNGNFSSQFIKSLLESGADPLYQDNQYGETYLHKILRVYLDHGCGIHCEGKCPVLIQESVKVLLDLGVNPTTKSKYAMSCDELLDHYENNTAASNKDRILKIRRLRELLHRNERLHEAQEHGDEERIAQALEDGAK